MKLIQLITMGESIRQIWVKYITELPLAFCVFRRGMPRHRWVRRERRPPKVMTKMGVGEKVEKGKRARKERERRKERRRRNRL